MSTKVANTVLKYLNDNPQILETLKNVPSLLKDKIPNMNIPRVVESVPMYVPQTPSIANVDVSSSMESIKEFFDYKMIITLVLVVWALFLIISQFMIKDKDTKENIKNTHEILLGNVGIIPLILLIWMVSIIMITIIPVITKSLPKIGSITSAISDAIISLSSK